jgi:hypothetical protein
MKFRNRLDRLEQRLDHFRFDGNDGRPMIIRIFGGIDVEPMRASIGAITIERGPDEDLQPFEDRAVRLAETEDATFIILGGLPDWVQ